MNTPSTQMLLKGVINAKFQGYGKTSADSSNGSVDAGGKRKKKEEVRLPDINPLTCKGSRDGFWCQLCKKKAYYRCNKCRLVYYCSTEHERIDMRTFHPLVCEAISYIAAPQPFKLFKVERQQQQQTINHHARQLLDIALVKAKEALLKKQFELAEYRCSYIERFSHQLYKRQDPNHIQPVLLSAESMALQGKIEKARKMLSRAQLTVSHNPDCRHVLKADFHRTQGIVEMSDKNYVPALYSFAEEVYWASEEYHPEHPRVAAAFYNIGTVLFYSGRNITAISYFNHVINIWLVRINDVFQETVEANENVNPLTTTTITVEAKIPEDEDILMETAIQFILKTFVDNSRAITKEQMLNVVCCLIQQHYIQGKLSRSLYYIDKAYSIVVEDGMDLKCIIGVDAERRGSFIEYNLANTSFGDEKDDDGVEDVRRVIPPDACLSDRTISFDNDVVRVENGGKELLTEHRVFNKTIDSESEGDLVSQGGTSSSNSNTSIGSCGIENSQGCERKQLNTGRVLTEVSDHVEDWVQTRGVDVDIVESSLDNVNSWCRDVLMKNVEDEIIVVDENRQEDVDDDVTVGDETGSPFGVDNGSRDLNGQTKKCDLKHVEENIKSLPATSIENGRCDDKDDDNLESESEATVTFYEKDSGDKIGRKPVLKVLASVSNEKPVRVKGENKGAVQFDFLTCFSQDLTKPGQLEWKDKLKYLRKVCRRQLGESPRTNNMSGGSSSSTTDRGRRSTTASLDSYTIGQGGNGTTDHRGLTTTGQTHKEADGGGGGKKDANCDIASKIKGGDMDWGFYANRDKRIM